MSSDDRGRLPSTPLYLSAPSLAPACERILVAWDAPQDALQDLLQRLLAAPEPVRILGRVTGNLGTRSEYFDELEDLEDRLQDLVEATRVGTRFIFCGDESFLWHFRALVHAAGVEDEEIELLRFGEARKLFCVHCATLQPIGTEAEVTCSACGVRLTVRQHFSRRLGAYMGSCLDANDPLGERSP